MAVAEGFRPLSRIGHHKAGVGVRQVEREEMDLALDAADDADRLAEIGLRMPGGCTSGTNISWARCRQPAT